MVSLIFSPFTLQLCTFVMFLGGGGLTPRLDMLRQEI